MKPLWSNHACAFLLLYLMIHYSSLPLMPDVSFGCNLQTTPSALRHICRISRDESHVCALSCPTLSDRIFDCLASLSKPPRREGTRHRGNKVGFAYQFLARSKPSDLVCITSDFDRRTWPPSMLAPRHTLSVTWWAPGSQTHVIITTARVIAGGAVMDLLNDAYTNIMDRIETLGDGNINGGSWAYNQVGLALRARNANNHQTTWAVLGAAIDALMDYMGTSGFEGACTFAIHDGDYQVGTGALEATNAAAAAR